MFKPTTDRDVPSIVALMNRAYRGRASSTAWNSEEAYIAGDRTTEALLRADLMNNVNAVLLKWIERPDEEASGCVWLEPLDAQTWYLGSLAADPARQNSGLGRRLLAGAEDWIRAHGGTRVRMTVVNVRETLIAWYLRRGYRLTGEIEPFPYGDNRFGTPLRDDLNFVVLQRDLTTDSTEL
jgi:ribosomal protein S18 acetylase RimI-like enzyme